MPRYLLDYELSDEDGPYACGRFQLDAPDEQTVRLNARRKVETFDVRADPSIDYVFQITRIEELEPDE